MLQPFYSTHPNARGEHDEYFVDHAGAYVMRERVRDLGYALTLRTDILATNTFFRSLWSPDEKGNWRLYWVTPISLRLGR